MNKKVIIFDFDGTIADSATVIKALYKDLAEERGWPELTDTAYRKLRKSTIAQGIKWIGVRPWQIPGLLREGRTLFKKHSSEIKLFAGIDKIIKDLHAQGWQVYVLSSNSPETIKHVLQEHKVADKMRILKRPPLFGKHKSIDKLVESEQYERESVWMVGDELRDIEAANKAEVNSIAVSWGLQDISVLKRAEPTQVAKKPADILKIVGIK